MRFAIIAFSLFIVVPLLEVFLLIKIGGVIGALPTIGLILLTAAMGALMLKQQGFSTVSRIRRSLDRGHLPAKDLLEAAFLLIGGVFLLTPGFFTDAIGFLCLIPITRSILIRLVVGRVATAVHNHVVQRNQDPHGQQRPNRIIDGDYRAEDDDERNLPPR